MPFAYNQAGLFLGTAILVVVAALTDRCCTILVRCKKRAVELQVARSGGALKPEDVHPLLTYGDTAREAYGPTGARTIDAALAFTQAGFCIQYSIFIITSLKSFVGAPPLVRAILPVAVLVPCALLPSVSALAPISTLANFAILSGFVAIVAYEVQEPSDLDVGGAPTANWGDAAIFFSIVMSCFEAIGTVLPVEASMASGPQNYISMLHVAVVFTTLFLGSFGCLGLLRFGDGVEQIATESLPSGSVVADLVHWCLLVAITCTYPLQVW